MRRIAFDHDQVRVLAGLDRANAGLFAFVNRAVQRGDPDGKSSISR